MLNLYLTTSSGTADRLAAGKSVPIEGHTKRAAEAIAECDKKFHNGK